MKEEDKIKWEVHYWSKEQKRFEIPWVNRKRHGVETRWHNNGQKWIENSWLDGEPHGISTWWNEDGSLLFVTKWNQGQLVVEFQFRKSDVPEGRVPEIDILTNKFKLL
jgi:antitoxin component YwqK of YwqJK toxin-antitoxin module